MIRVGVERVLDEVVDGPLPSGQYAHPSGSLFPMTVGDYDRSESFFNMAEGSGGFDVDGERAEDL